MLTINGIYTDIFESTYSIKLDNMRFFFSSKVYKEKFEKRYESFCIEERRKLELKYGATIKCKSLMLIKLYTMIEKRGFRIEIDDKTLQDVPLFKIDYII